MLGKWLLLQCKLFWYILEMLNKNKFDVSWTFLVTIIQTRLHTSYDNKYQCNYNKIVEKLKCCEQSAYKKTQDLFWMSSITTSIKTSKGFVLSWFWKSVWFGWIQFYLKTLKNKKRFKKHKCPPGTKFKRVTYIRWILQSTS